MITAVAARFNRFSARVPGVRDGARPPILRG